MFDNFFLRLLACLYKYSIEFILHSRRNENGYEFLIQKIICVRY